MIPSQQQQQARRLTPQQISKIASHLKTTGASKRINDVKGFLQDKLGVGIMDSDAQQIEKMAGIVRTSSSRTSIPSQSAIKKESLMEKNSSLENQLKIVKLANQYATPEVYRKYKDFVKAGKKKNGIFVFKTKINGVPAQRTYYKINGEDAPAGDFFYPPTKKTVAAYKKLFIDFYSKKAATGSAKATGKAPTPKSSNSNADAAREKMIGKLPAGPLGKVLFADDRDDQFGNDAFMRKHGEDLETNTPAENELIKAFIAHLGGDNFGSKNIKTIKALLAKGLYSDILTRPKQEYVFRGVNASPERLAKILNTSVDKLSFYGKQVLKTPLYYNSRGGKETATSWTVDPKVALEFTNMNDTAGRKNFIRVVLVANTKENDGSFIDMINYYNKIDSEYKDEKEVVGLGNIKVKAILWKTVETVTTKDLSGIPGSKKKIKK